MEAELLDDYRLDVDERSFAEVVIWHVPQPVHGSSHHFKYRLAFVLNDVCVLRYDNELGKGDHKHLGPAEEAYAFSTIDKLLADFWTDVNEWRKQHESRDI